jgi:hypothetical protein
VLGKLGKSRVGKSRGQAAILNCRLLAAGLGRSWLGEPRQVYASGR